VQLKDKLIEDRDAAHAESQQREERGEREDQLPEPVTEAVRDAGHERRAQLLGAVRMILGRDRLDIGQLRMPPREARALAMLQSAVEGRSSDINSFVYAEDRRDLLERALGVLQPDLAHTDDLHAQELHAQLGDLSERLGELREQLSSLEDAQDELISAPQTTAAVVQDDQPKPVPSDPDAPRPATTLTGPDLPAQEPAPTTLTGPDLPEGKPEPTTLIGPDLPAQKPAETTLTGADLPEGTPAATTLLGPDLPEAAPPPSTLGDGQPSDDPSPDGKAKRPWWRRPFG
jgi:hypothetical protein